MGDVEDGGEVLGEDGGEDDYGGKDGTHTNPICYSIILMIPTIPTHTNQYQPIKTCTNSYQPVPTCTNPYQSILTLPGEVGVLNNPYQPIPTFTNPH